MTITIPLPIISFFAGLTMFVIGLMLGICLAAYATETYNEENKHIYKKHKK